MVARGLEKKNPRNNSVGKKWTDMNFGNKTNEMASLIASHIYFYRQ